MSIQLGRKVRDTITGFSGTVIARHEYLSGCTRYSVQPAVSVTEPNKIPDAATFDQPQLEIIEATQHVNPTPNRGGPRDEPKREAVPAR